MQVPCVSVTTAATLTFHQVGAAQHQPSILTHQGGIPKMTGLIASSEAMITTSGGGARSFRGYLRTAQMQWASVGDLFV
jgi:hypothetical protein